MDQKGVTMWLLLATMPPWRKCMNQEAGLNLIKNQSLISKNPIASNPIHITVSPI